MSEFLLYAGYGANRDPKMIGAITGKLPKVMGAVALKDVELCVQTYDQLPDQIVGNQLLISAKEVIELNWDDSEAFETYTIGRRPGSSVRGTLFALSNWERNLVGNWEMVELGW